MSTVQLPPLYPPQGSGQDGLVGQPNGSQMAPSQHGNRAKGTQLLTKLTVPAWVSIQTAAW